MPPPLVKHYPKRPGYHDDRLLPQKQQGIDVNKAWLENPSLQAVSTVETFANCHQNDKPYHT